MSRKYLAVILVAGVLMAGLALATAASAGKGPEGKGTKTDVPTTFSASVAGPCASEQVLLGNFNDAPKMHQAESQPAPAAKAPIASPVQHPGAPFNQPRSENARGTFSFILDDGSRDNDIGIGGTWEMLWGNRFTPAPGDFPFQLTSIQVYFSTVGLIQVGDPIRLVVFENVAGAADPGPGSSLLAQYATTVQAVDNWSVFDVSGLGINCNGPGDIFIGVIALKVPGSSYWPASLDQTTTAQRSWAGWYLTSPPPDPAWLPCDDTWTLIDSYFPGNWMVRGTGVSADAPCTLTCMASATPTAGVAPLSVDFTATATLGPTCVGPATYLWDFGDGTTSTEQNPSHVYTAGGTFTWTLTVASDGVTCTQTGTITANPFDLTFCDDYGRSALCVNSTSGAFTYWVLRGFGVGPYSGVGTITRYNGAMYLRTPATSPVYVNLQYLERYRKASASMTCRPGRVTSTLYDSNTTNNPAFCTP